ncbi:MAG: argininosuccinate synthase [Treponema sp.]|nr:argininosuccinate synthase [Treponema sp.]
MNKKIVMAYSGGLNSTVSLAWLKENFDCDVVALCADVGQAVDWKSVKKRAMAAGASACHVVDVKKELVEQFFWHALKAGAVYENNYLPGTAAVHMLIAETLVEFAKTEKADGVAYGAENNGNSHVRLALGIIELAPELELFIPWNMWKIKNRKDLLRYAARKNLPITEKKKETYITDSSILHFSHEGLDLDDPGREPQYKKILSMTVSPEKAPNRAEYIEIEFDKGIPISLNGKKMDSVNLIKELNKIGGANGIGITDMVENQIFGIKNRSVFEIPAVSLLSFAHHELERICLDSQTNTYKKQVSLKMGELIYNGFWFTPLREALSAFVDVTQIIISGKVKLKLYKGAILPAGASSPYSMIMIVPLEKPEKKTGARKAPAAENKKPAAAKAKLGKKPGKKTGRKTINKK